MNGEPIKRLAVSLLVRDEQLDQTGNPAPRRRKGRSEAARFEHQRRSGARESQQ